MIAAVLVLSALAAQGSFATPPPPIREQNLSANASKDTEPSVAINPRDPENVIVAFMHNLSAELAVDNQRTELAVTHDGGKTWVRQRVPFGTAVDKNTADVHVRFDRFGAAYVAAVAFSDTYHTGADWIMKSIDGGRTWAPPTVMMRDTDVIPNAIDRPWIATGNRPGHVYMTSNPAFTDHVGAVLSKQYFRASYDSGRSWGPVRRVDSEQYPADTVPSGYLSVDRRGVLAVVYVARAAADAAGTGRTCPCIVLALSRDEGATWSHRSAPTLGPNFGYAVPESGEPVLFRAQTAAIGEPDPTTQGRYAVVHTFVESQAAYLAGIAPMQVALLVTHDYGRTWQRPLVLTASTVMASSTAWPAWSDQGRLGVIWRQFSQTRASMPFSVWMACSSYSGRSFGAPVRISREESADTGGLGDEYLALASRGGRTWAAWSDARGATPQVYAASIPRVAC